MPLKTKIKKPYYLMWVTVKMLPLKKRVCRNFFISRNFHWICKNKHQKYVSYLKIHKNKHTQFFCRRTRILNEKTKFRFKLFFYRSFMEEHIIGIYTFSVLLSWFCFSLELSDQRNIFQKNETSKLTAFPIKI